MLRRIFSTCILFALSTATVLAQAEIGGSTLNGTITDATSAAVPGAKVTVTNRDTGLSRTTTTNEAGQYTFPTLPVGTYDLTAEKQGVLRDLHYSSGVPVLAGALGAGV